MAVKNNGQSSKAGTTSKFRAILRYGSPFLVVLLLGGLALAFNSADRIIGLIPDIPLPGDSDSKGPAVLSGSSTRERSSRLSSGGSGSTIDLSMALDPDMFNAALSISEADSPSGNASGGSLIPRMNYTATGSGSSWKPQHSTWNPLGHSSQGGNTGGSSFSSLGGISGGSGGSDGSSGGSSRNGTSYNQTLSNILAFATSSGQKSGSDDSSSGGSSSGDSGSSSDSEGGTNSPMLVSPRNVVVALDLPTILSDTPDPDGGGNDAPVPNPEPGTLVLGGMGLASLIAARRRRKAGKTEE